MSILREEFERGREQLRLITQTLGADLGVRLDVGGERIFVVDNLGRQLSEMVVAAALASLALRDKSGGTILVPPHAPHIFTDIAAQHGAQVWRARLDGTDLTCAGRREEVRLATDGLGNFIFPAFQPTVDGLYAVAKLLEFLAREGSKFSEVVDNLPTYTMSDKRIAFPWTLRGAIMRQLNERYQSLKDPDAEGVRLPLAASEWVLMLPNPDEPYMTVYAEGPSAERAVELVDKYSGIVQSMLS